MKPLPGITRVTIRKSKNILFVVAQPDVFKSPNSDTYIIFGEAKIEDLAASATNRAAEQFKKAPEAAKPAASQSAAAESNDAGEVDASGIDEKDIQLVMSQGDCSRSKAITALRNNDNDIVNAIMEVTM